MFGFDSFREYHQYILGGGQISVWGLFLGKLNKIPLKNISKKKVPLKTTFSGSMVKGKVNILS